MTNYDRFKTVSDRVDAYWAEHIAPEYTCSRGWIESFARWLGDEAIPEKPLQCPFCGGECKVSHEWNGKCRVTFVKCASGRMCWYSSGAKDTEADAIAAHNRVAKAVKGGAE